MSDGGPDPDAAPPPRRRRWTAWVLGASLCLNLLLIGALAGAAMGNWGPHSAEIPTGFDRRTLWRVYKGLPEAEQDRIEAVVRDLRRELSTIAEDRMRARLDMAESLEAETVSPEALNAAMAEARVQAQANRNVIDAAFAEFAAGLDRPTRRMIAEALRKPPRRFRHDDEDDD
ncbi:MAG: periplasmic heavy metal sensor [Pseudomonadota bacterium]